MACDGDPPAEDAGFDAGADAGVDAGPEIDSGPIVLFEACEDTQPEGTTSLEPVASTLVGTIVPDVARLSSPGSRNPASAAGEGIYREMGLDGYSRGPAQARVTRDELGGDAPPAAGRRSLAYFVHYSDFQLVDDESPTRLAAVDTAGIPGGLRAQEAYLPRAVSAMNRTLARIERAERPYDFGVLTGDCADSSQLNETEWVIDLMNGAPGLHTDSGDDDDPLPGPDNDPKDPFDPTAFPAPWLYVAGNHDVLVVGISLPDTRLMDTAIGTTPVGGTRDYRRPFGAVSSASVPADPDRRIVSRDDIVQMLLEDEAGEGPVGHGFTAPADLAVGANYAYDAIPGLLRVLALDTNDDTGGSNGLVHRPTVDDFLIPELERAETDGVLVMLASHHSTLSIDVFQGQIGTTVVPDAVPASELESLVAGYDNVVAWLVGHSHTNLVRAIPGADSAHPGYWEIMTAAVADYPGQARLVEVVDNGDGTLSILGTVLDFDEESCQERRFRRLMTMEYVSAWTDLVSTDASDINVELLRAVPATAVDNVAAATGHDRIESETTLRGE